MEAPMTARFAVHPVVNIKRTRRLVIVVKHYQTSLNAFPGMAPTVLGRTRKALESTLAAILPRGIIPYLNTNTGHFIEPTQPGSIPALASHAAINRFLTSKAN